MLKTMSFNFGLLKYSLNTYKESFIEVLQETTLLGVAHLRGLVFQTVENILIRALQTTMF